MVRQVSRSDEIDFDAQPSAVGGSEAAAGAAGAEGSGSIDGTAAAAANRAIAEGLASGAIDPAAAQQVLIDQVLAEQPPGLAPEQLERLRGELAALLESDPALKALLRS